VLQLGWFAEMDVLTWIMKAPASEHADVAAAPIIQAEADRPLTSVLIHNLLNTVCATRSI